MKIEHAAPHGEWRVTTSDAEDALIIHYILSGATYPSRDQACAEAERRALRDYPRRFAHINIEVRWHKREIPRVGGTIEDETGWWVIEEVDDYEETVLLLGRKGEEREVSFENLGPVEYDCD